MDYPAFEFVREDVQEHCETAFGNYEEEIEYLEWIKNEYECNKPKLDPNTRHPVPFIEFVEKQIKHRKGCIERDKKAAEKDDDLCRISGDRGNVVRIFEAMKKAEIIETNTQPKYIVNIFVKDTKAKREMAQYYSNKSKEIINLGTKTNNPELLKFVKIIIEDSFKGKTDIVQELKVYLAHL